MSEQEGQDRIDTLCGTCIFAGYNEDKVQTNCAANDMLHRLQQQGKQVVLEDMDDHKCFKIIDCVCHYWRPSTWHESATSDEELAALVDAARREMMLDADIIVYCGPNTTFDEIACTVDSIKKMSIQPIRIYFANDHMERPGKFTLWVQENVELKWRVESVLTEYDNFLRAIDAVSDKCQSRFVSVFRAGFQVPPNFLQELDIALHDRLERFVYLTPIDDLNGTTFIRNIHSLLKGNKYGMMAEQIKKLSEEQQCPEMIRLVQELVPSMLA